MANNWTSLQMTMTKNNSTQVVHYETDTANIVDFEQASNNLISAALNVFATNTTLKGTTTINKIKTNSSIDISTGEGGGIYLRNPEDPNEVFGHLYYLHNENEDDLKLFAGLQHAGNGSQGYGAGIILERIPDNSSGRFRIVAAKNNSERIELIGNPQTGKLTWGGKELVDKSMLENNDFKKMILNLIYPVGSVIYTATSTLPGNIGSLGGTWTQIAKGRVIVGVGSGTDSNSTSKSFTAGNNAGEYSHKLVTNELANHGHGSGGTITTSAAGNHVHSRGNMEIEGTMNAVWEINTTPIVTGAFRYTRNIGDSNECGDDGSARLVWDFKASRSWSGYTSSPLNPSSHAAASNHTHTVTVSLSNTGGNGFHNNVQPSYGLYIWQRTA